MELFFGVISRTIVTIRSQEAYMISKNNIRHCFRHLAQLNEVTIRSINYSVQYEAAYFQRFFLLFTSTVYFGPLKTIHNWTFHHIRL